MHYEFDGHDLDNSGIQPSDDQVGSNAKRPVRLLPLFGHRRIPGSGRVIRSPRLWREEMS